MCLSARGSGETVEVSCLSLISVQMQIPSVTMKPSFLISCFSLTEIIFRKKKDAAERRNRYDFRPRTLEQMMGRPSASVNKNLQLESNPNGNRYSFVDMKAQGGTMSVRPCGTKCSYCIFLAQIIKNSVSQSKSVTFK